MHRRKLQQIKAYSKVIKRKKQNGQIEEIVLNQKQNQNTQIIEQKPVVELPPDEQFQDQFQDQFQQEEVWESEPESEQNDEKIQEEGKMTLQKNKKSKLQQLEQMQQEQVKKTEVFLGTNKQLKKGEILDFDNNAYDMLHRLNIQWPSLSIDFVCKSSPFEQFSGFKQMNSYPYQVYTVQGSSNNTNTNFVYLTKWSKLHQTKYDDDPELQQQGEQNNDQQPELFCQQISTNYDINRIRSLNGSPIVAFWADLGSKGGQVHLMDLTANYQKLKNNITTKKPEKVKQIIIPLPSAGYAINWNPKSIGQLAVGNDQGHISILANNQNYTSWSVLTTYTYHKSSVQDIFFSPQQNYIFASCSSDGTLQITDMRVNNTKQSQLKIKAHDKDVNVGDWNSLATHLIVTGGDDCQVKVWDLRMCKGNNSQQLLCFNWHTQPITSISFQPNQDSGVVAVASEDNSVSIWDLSAQNQQKDPQIPNQLMFLHQGQQQIKQIRFHPIYYQMLISSALDSINIFKPSYEMPEEDEEINDDKQDLKRPPIKQQDLDQFLGRMSLQ